MAFPYDTNDQDAIDRLDGTYNGNAYDAGSNAGGMAAGGHRINFIPALEDVATVAEAIADAAGAASTSASAASTSETNAATSAAKLAGTSATAVAIGTGSKSFTTQSGKSFSTGTWLNIRSAANPALNYMIGQVTAYSGTALTVNVPIGASGGSGTYSDWTIDVSGAPGQIGLTGLTGLTGAMPAVQWNFASTTADADPGNGLFRLNSGTVTSVTSIYLDNLNKDSADLTAWIDSFDDSTNTADRGRVYLQQADDPTKFAVFKITGAVVDGTGYRKVPVSYVAATPVAFSAVPFTNTSAVGVVFVPTSNKGADGGGAGDLIGPSGATDAAVALFDTTTGKLLKDSGVGIGTSGAKLSRLDTGNTWSGVQSMAALLDIQQNLRLSGDISPSQITSNQNDYNPAGLSTASVLRLNTDASRNITSLAGGADGRVLALLDIGSNPFVLTHDDGATGTAANRFSLPDGLNLSIGAGGAALIIYDATSSRWRLLSTAVPFNGGKNFCINGTFAIWQRGQGPWASGAAQYTVDRWKFVRDSAAADASVAIGSAPAGSVVSWNIRLARVNATSGTGGIDFYTAYESAFSRSLAGQIITVSFFAKAGANYSDTSNAFQSRIHTGTGTDQSADNMIAGTWTGANADIKTHTISTTRTRYFHTFTLPTNATQFGLRFRRSPTGTAGAADHVDIDSVQFQVGGLGTYAYRTPIEEFMDCCLYYEDLGIHPYTGVRWLVVIPTNAWANGAGGGIGTTQYILFNMQFNPKRSFNYTTTFPTTKATDAHITVAGNGSIYDLTFTDLAHTTLQRNLYRAEYTIDAGAHPALTNGVPGMLALDGTTGAKFILNNEL